MKTQGFERRFSQNLAPVSREKPQNPYLDFTFIQQALYKLGCFRQLGLELVES
jgi:hypothetical protein